MVNERSDYEDIYRSHGNNDDVPDGRRCECSRKSDKFRNKQCKFLNNDIR
jgi:hypothetical protein